MSNIEMLFREYLSKLTPHLTKDHDFREDLCPRFNRKPDEGTYIVKDELRYTERGEDNLIIKGSAVEILHIVFDGLTQTLATNFEVRNRNPKTDDTRKDWFPLQQELMGHINEEWKLELKRKHSLLLSGA